MKTHQRNRLWFGKYDYRVKIHLPEGSALRSLDHARIDSIIKSRRDWGERIARTQPGSWSRSWIKASITDQQVENLHHFCDFLLNDSRERKIVITGDMIYLYTNDPQLLPDVAALGFLQQKHVTMERLELVGEPNTVPLRHAAYRFRSYFRETRVDAAQLQLLKNFLQVQQDLRVSRALSDALEFDKTKWLFSYYFIDHDNPSITTMLGMLIPRAIRATLPIVAAK